MILIAYHTVTMGALSGKVIIVIIACISVVVIATIVIPIVVIFSKGESTMKSTKVPTTTLTTKTTTTGGFTMTSIYSSTSFAGECNSGWIGDNYCDDINNNMDCSYDGGDCCGCNINADYCSVCACLDPNGSGGGTTCPPITTTTHNPGNYAQALNYSQ